MSLPPEIFKGMDAGQIALVLAVDEAATRKQHARDVGARCTDCLDTGMRAGRFCGCERGVGLGLQSYGAGK